MILNFNNFINESNIDAEVLINDINNSKLYKKLFSFSNIKQLKVSDEHYFYIDNLVSSDYFKFSIQYMYYSTNTNLYYMHSSMNLPNTSQMSDDLSSILSDFTLLVRHRIGSEALAEDIDSKSLVKDYTLDNIINKFLNIYIYETTVAINYNILSHSKEFDPYYLNLHTDSSYEHLFDYWLELQTKLEDNNIFELFIKLDSNQFPNELISNKLSVIKKLL